MLMAVSVVLGFKNEVQKKVVGIGAHIQILNYQVLSGAESQPIVIDESLADRLSAIPGVSSVQPFCQKTGMLKTDESFQGVLFQGISQAYDLSFLRANLVEGDISEPFSSAQNSGRLVVSKRLADELHLQVGSRVFAYFFDDRLRARRFTVEALYATNMSEYDTRLVFCDFRTVHQLLGYEPDQASGAEVVLSDMSLLEQVSEQVTDIVNRQQDRYGAYYTSPTIKDLYPHIFAWLDLLDLNVLVILALMMAVAGFTTISGLLIIILEHTRFVGVMKAMGASNSSLRHVFIYYAVRIIGRGILVGNVVGLCLCFVQMRLGLLHLDASTYYVDTVPVLISWSWVAIINIATFALSLLAMLLPSFLVSRIQPSKSIRFE